MQGHDTDRIKRDDRDWSVECLQCGQSFEAARSDATFCSPRCRVAYGREEDKMLNFITWANTVAANALTGAQKYKRNKRVFEAMLKLQKDVNAAVSIFEID